MAFPPPPSFFAEDVVHFKCYEFRQEREKTVYNITLIGMPGSGKSTVGVLLAKALGFGFLDTDLVIQQQEGALLQDILDRRGVPYFLDAEERSVTIMSSPPGAA